MIHIAYLEGGKKLGIPHMNMLAKHIHMPAKLENGFGLERKASRGVHDCIRRTGFAIASFLASVKCLYDAPTQRETS